MLFLHGLGHFHPENIITNRFLADLDIGCSEEWIIERVGIRTRRTVLSLDYIASTKNSDPRAAKDASMYNHRQMGAFAARMALRRAGISPEDIGMVISGSSAPDYVSPAEASSIAMELGITVPCLDVNSACSTFGSQMRILASMKPKELPPFVLVVNPESLTQTVDYADRRAVPIFGDGSSAAVVSPTVKSAVYIDDCLLDSNPQGWNKVAIPRYDYFSQDGNAVQGFAIRKTTEGLRRLMATSKGRDIVKFVGHQANLGVLTTVCDRCGIEEENHWYNVDIFGNTGCSSAPAVLSQHWDSLHSGDSVAMVVVGSGLTWASLMIKVS
ncbi:MAG: ketoacyl-ACP synthase III [Syntrophales bacterium]|jgi:3-oxoacyl-[acyl-carrier-protein] synthase-3|nr:ketoacyl-ACP synthase III [Syntrophales bacterium]MDY0045411.1 ketoacyl-ACP synthase III [Syntrophales bacterium]